MTTKLVFKSPELEKSVREFARKVNVEKLDEQIQKQVGLSNSRIEIYDSPIAADPIFTLSRHLFTIKEVFDPDHWNEPNVDLPKMPNENCSPWLIVEDFEGNLYKTFYDFDENHWTDQYPMCRLSDIRRIRLFPED